MPARYLAFQVGQLDARLSAVERDMAAIRHWEARLVILVLLWLMALGSHLEADKAIDLAVKVLKAL